jgi:hypothetical protein
MKVGDVAPLTHRNSAAYLAKWPIPAKLSSIVNVWRNSEPVENELAVTEN